MRGSGGGLWIGVWHPFVSGRLSRWLRVEKMIEYMLNTGDVWFARLEDIAAHVQKLRKEGSYQAAPVECISASIATISSFSWSFRCLIFAIS
jgi:hypothetical protein